VSFAIDDEGNLTIETSAERRAADAWRRGQQAAWERTLPERDAYEAALDKLYDAFVRGEECGADVRQAIDAARVALLAAEKREGYDPSTLVQVLAAARATEAQAIAKSDAYHAARGEDPWDCVRGCGERCPCEGGE
jgi:hypothetical protein